MKTMILALAIVLGMVGNAMADDKATLSEKAWKIVKSEDAPAGTTFHFGSDGSFKLVITVDGKAREMAGTYTLSGMTLTIKLSRDGRERVDVRSIRKLTKDSLVLEDKNRKVEELSR